ncbi:VgrG protein [hydrothermal vent metagenome]|uniref:VgrG protein n=1 Tax=hydrothermal vent metagenome TaxID=652676 RepID=A0A3B1AHN8_9ZZZZ
MVAVSIRQTNDVPMLSIEVDGVELPSTIPVSTVEIIYKTNRIPFARIKINDGLVADGDFPYSSGDYFIPGKELSIVAGYRDEVAPLFTGLVLSQRIVVRSNQSYLVIECRDPAIKMALSKKNRYYDEQTDSDIAETLISEYGLTADITSSEVVHPQLMQYQSSDWDFMISRLESSGQLCVVEDGTVQSYIPNLDADANIDIVFGDTLIAFDAEFDARSQSAAVTSLSWNPADQNLQEVDAVEVAWQNNSDLNTDDMTSATEHEVDLLMHGGSLASDALQSWADGALVRSRLAASRGRARFRGVTEIRLGDTVQLSEISSRFNGKVHTTGVRHEFSNNNWTTDIEFGLSRKTHAEKFNISQLPAAGLTPSISGLHIGVVTQLADDPAAENRVKVKIPIAGMNEQGVWARVSTLDAGSDRGTFFRPELDDEVVLGFFHDDPAQPVMLGMLHSSAKAPPIEPSEDNHEKAYVSREGLRFHFDDDQKVITLETPGANKIVLSDADGGILLEDQNGNKIELNGDGVFITSANELNVSASTDLKLEAVNAEIKASAELKADGGASAELSSSGMLTVKGSLVQIN